MRRTLVPPFSKDLKNPEPLSNVCVPSQPHGQHTLAMLALHAPYRVFCLLSQTSNSQAFSLHALLASKNNNSRKVSLFGQERSCSGFSATQLLVASPSVLCCSPPLCGAAFIPLSGENIHHRYDFRARLSKVAAEGQGIHEIKNFLLTLVTVKCEDSKSRPGPNLEER